MAREVDRRLRSEVARRAGYRCEYCLINERDTGFPHQVDHIVSRKHGGFSDFANLAYACVICNRNKGSDVASIDPITGDAVRLFHPRRDGWNDHLALAGEVIEPRSKIGAATVQVLHLNTSERLAERRLLQSLGTYPLKA